MDNRNNSEDSLIPQMPILIVTVTDSDLFESNKFVFQIINNNKNWDHFSLTANSDASASLRVIKPLDYESHSQRNINLTIGVSDNGSNFSDTYHTDYCVIHVRLRDINDNEPQFVKSNIEVSVAEDSKLGSIITKFHATDADQSGLSRVSYQILRESDKRRQFSIDSNGIVRLERLLDREKLSKHKLLILATDDGNPSKSSTATLTISVDDVNDNAPNLLNNYLPVIMENSAPQKIGEIFAFDLDDKTKGFISFAVLLFCSFLVLK
jgi:dynein heavy chain 2